MRLLVACSQCKRQYDVGGRAVGSRFRCYCGTTVTVRQPRGHEAAVVRCSSCGGPRTANTTACKYCGADFTLHDQDLDTVCPQCFARLSDRAKFCHHCGVAIMPETLLGEKTALLCPACGKQSRLEHRQVGETALLECGRCAGLWLGNEVFGRMIETASRNVSGLDWRLQGSAKRTGVLGEGNQNAPFYRQCPYCGKLMVRRNYASHSGVIIDVCRDHGVWFDADELPRILAWVRSGGKAEAERRQADDQARQQRLDAIVRTARWRGPLMRDLHEGDNQAELLSSLGALLVKLFT